MAKIRLTKEFHFEMAHALWNYDGLCKNIHGHSYMLEVTIIGEPVSDENSPKLGMVMDFGELKSIINKEIIDRLDHCVVVNSKMPENQISILSEITERLIVADYQPTCENFLIDFAQRLKRYFSDTIKLHSLKLRETSSSYAEWYYSDNI